MNTEGKLREALMNGITDLIINHGDSVGGYRYKTGWECLAPIKQKINEVFDKSKTSPAGQVDTTNNDIADEILLRCIEAGYGCESGHHMWRAEIKEALDAKDAEKAVLQEELELCPKLTDSDVKRLGEVFEECEFSGSESDCNFCDHPTKRTWWLRTSHEYIEGDYYCDLCALKKIEDWDAQGFWYEGQHYKEEFQALTTKAAVLVAAIQANGKCSQCGGTGKTHHTREGISKWNTPCWRCPDSCGLEKWANNALQTYKKGEGA